MNGKTFSIITIAVILLVIVAFFLMNFVLADDTGLKSPSTASSVTWGNQNNIKVSDDSYTTSSTIGDLLTASDYNLNIPNNSVIKGIEVRVEGKAFDLGLCIG